MESDNDTKKVNEAKNRLPQASTATGRDKNKSSRTGINQARTGGAQNMSSTPKTDTPRSRKVDKQVPYSNIHQLYTKNSDAKSNIYPTKPKKNQPYKMDTCGN